MKVRFTIGIEGLVKSSGRYDSRPRQTSEQVITMLWKNIRLGHDNLLALRRHGAARIECSAESFVSFLVARCEAGHINGFRTLDVELVEPTHASSPLPLLVELP